MKKFEFTDEQVLVLAKACEILTGIHLGNLQPIVDTPNLEDDCDFDEWKMDLLQISSYITGKVTGNFRNLDDKLVKAEADICNKLRKTFLDAIL